MQIDLFSSLRGPDEILKDWKYECALREDTLTSFGKCKNDEDVNMSD